MDVEELNAPLRSEISEDPLVRRNLLVSWRYMQIEGDGNSFRIVDVPVSKSLSVLEHYVGSTKVAHGDEIDACPQPLMRVNLMTRSSGEYLFNYRLSHAARDLQHTDHFFQLVLCKKSPAKSQAPPSRVHVRCLLSPRICLTLD